MATEPIVPRSPVDPVSADRHERRSPPRDRRAPAGAAAEPVDEDDAAEGRPIPVAPPGRLDVRV
jgi:hypothetical protein